MKDIYFVLRTELVYTDRQTGDATYSYQVVAATEGDESHAKLVLEHYKKIEPGSQFIFVKRVNSE
jgi:hypothetical protein